MNRCKRILRQVEKIFINKASYFVSDTELLEVITMQVHKLSDLLKVPSFFRIFQKMAGICDPTEGAINGTKSKTNAADGLIIQ